LSIDDGDSFQEGSGFIELGAFEMDLSAAAVVEENDAFKQKTAELSLHLREVANYTKIQPALIS
jgi:hypothetical protein